MYSAVRRTGTYLYSSAAASAPRSVRAPHTTRPNTAKLRRQLTPCWLSRPHCRSVSPTVSPAVPLSDASVPAGAFHTPRVVSVRASTPATIPLGANDSIWPPSNGSEASRRG